MFNAIAFISFHQNMMTAKILIALQNHACLGLQKKNTQITKGEEEEEEEGGGAGKRSVIQLHIKLSKF